MVTSTALFVNLTIDLIVPAIHGIKPLLYLSSINVLSIFCWFSLFNASLISHSAPAKFVLMSLLNKHGFPQGQVNLQNAIRKLPADKSPARSM